MLLKNQWVNAEIKKNILKYLETNDNENTTIQNPWNAARAVLRGKFIAIRTFLKEKKKGKISNKPPNIPPKRITQQNLKSRVNKIDKSLARLTKMKRKENPNKQNKK